MVRRELRTVPGEKFSRADIIRTQRELASLVFSILKKSAPILFLIQDNGTVDITWGVEEKSNDQLELSAGFGGGHWAYGNTGYYL